MILGGVPVCLLLSAHRAVIFAIAQLPCLYIDRVISIGDDVGVLRRMMQQPYIYWRMWFDASLACHNELSS